jgi:hypothetical protein
MTTCKLPGEHDVASLEDAMARMAKMGYTPAAVSAYEGPGLIQVFSVETWGGAAYGAPKAMVEVRAGILAVTTP